MLKTGNYAIGDKIQLCRITHYTTKLAELQNDKLKIIEGWLIDRKTDRTNPKKVRNGRQINSQNYKTT